MAKAEHPGTSVELGSPINREFQVKVPSSKHFYQETLFAFVSKEATRHSRQTRHARFSCPEVTDTIKHRPPATNHVHPHPDHERAFCPRCALYVDTPAAILSRFRRNVGLPNRAALVSRPSRRRDRCLDLCACACAPFHHPPSVHLSPFAQQHRFVPLLCSPGNLSSEAHVCSRRWQ